MGSTTLNSLRVAGSVICACAGAGMALFGAVRILAEPNRAALIRTTDALQAGQNVDPVLQELTRTELRRAQDGSLVSLAGLVAIAQAQSAGFETSEGRLSLDRAVSDLKRGLSRSPGDGMAWLRLAGATYLRDGPSPEAGAAMRMAVYLVKPNPSTSALYFQLAAGLWTRLTPDVQEQVRGKFQAAWQSPLGRRWLEGLVAFPAGQATLRQLLADQPDLEAWIAQQMRALESERERRALQ